MIYKTTYSRIFFIVLLLGLTFFYSHYQKKSIDDYMAVSNKPILQKLPVLEITKVGEETKIDAKTLVADQSRGLMVHFWGTWCAPCEAELPSFVDLARKFKDVPVNFLIIAVNDEVKKIKKFLKRLDTLPANVYMGIDNSGKSMDRLGTVKVPETYLFDKKEIHIRKFIGPQDWSQPIYVSIIRDLLSI